MMFLEGGYLDILIAIRDHIHGGFRLLTHPLYGSMKPNQTPYRTVMLEKGEAMDFRSLELIETCITAAEKFQRNRPTPHWDERILEDFRTVDLSFMKRVERVASAKL